MKNLTWKLMLGAATMASAMAMGAPAFADDAPAPPSWGTISAYVAVTSDYRFRGISQNNSNISPQASINWTGPEGFYAGVWSSKVDWTGLAFSPIDEATPTVEIDLYGGKHFDLGGWDLNVEAYYYAYPDADKFVLGPKKASFFEGIFQLSHSFGDLALTATGAVSPEFSLGGGTGGYIEGTASYPLTDWLSISGNVGHQWVENAPTDYTHFDLGLTATWRHFAFDVRANGTDLNSAGCNFYMASSLVNNTICTTGVVGTITYNIPDLLNP
ncbi:MAG TPA: TorF family putative porin [Rhizomicrobium sp.]|jgi:uncharacterized protein (TIGR02001 family)|nr:TorF family putative porin [Rhizomicrobium sp.]